MFCLYYSVIANLTPSLCSAVFIDCRSISKSVFEYKYIELYENLRRKGTDYKTDLLSTSPVYHFFIGGIVINTKAETTLKGLLVCGEAAGGPHGANRLTRNGLSEAVIFGAYFGRIRTLFPELSGQHSGIIRTA